MGARIAQRIERVSHPKEGDLLAFRFDQLGLLVFEFAGRCHLNEFCYGVTSRLASPGS
jgi:hypothetical protein